MQLEIQNKCNAIYLALVTCSHQENLRCLLCMTNVLVNPGFGKLLITTGNTILDLLGKICKNIMRIALSFNRCLKDAVRLDEM